MTVAKRTLMTMYSGSLDIYSHRVRIVLAEKAVNVDVVNIALDEVPEELHLLNPYDTVPTLEDRGLVLYNSSIIMEYLDERFPHPPLLPVYPVVRAKSRLMMFRIDEDWYSLARKIEEAPDINTPEIKAVRKALLEAMVSIAPVFADRPYFLSDDFSLVDCCIAPLLWRFPKYGIKIPTRAKAVREYAKRMFERESFQVSLTEAERELGEQHDL